MWAFALVWIAPTLATAQQSGIFPLAPARHRQRVPCTMEDPVYGLYRHEYFGYHPTCWRRFPPGWGCPSPEAPNVVAEFRERPRDPAPELSTGDDFGPPGGPGMGPDQPGGQPGRPDQNLIPPLPAGERSPFELDSPTEPKPRPLAPPRRGPGAPDVNPPTPPPATNPPDAGGSQASAAPEVTPSAPESELAPPLLALPEPGGATPLNGSPGLPPIGPEPVPPGPSASTGAALPLPSVAPPSASADVFPPAAPSATTTAPARAPRRPSLIGGLLGNLGLRRR